jgi:hypoxanthine phosphoribosyltransferase
VFANGTDESKPMKKIFYTWKDVETAANAIMSDLVADRWRPDYIVGITRGGLPLALLLSHRLDVRLETLKVKLRDAAPDESCETNCWMADDAYGYGTPSLPATRKKILVVDDINDTGATFNWIKKDWQSSCRPEDPAWTDQIWGGNVRFAVMTANLSSEFDSVSYYWHEVNKAEDDVWLVYPWEKDSWLKPSME